MDAPLLAFFTRSGDFEFECNEETIELFDLKHRAVQTRRGGSTDDGSPEDCRPCQKHRRKWLEAIRRRPLKTIDDTFGVSLGSPRQFEDRTASLKHGTSAGRTSAADRRAEQIARLVER